MSNMSKARSLDTNDFTKQAKSALIYFIPVFLMYVSPVVAELQKEGHIVSLTDFALTPPRVTAILLWVMMQLEGLLIRWAAGSKK